MYNSGSGYSSGQYSPYNRYGSGGMYGGGYNRYGSGMYNSGYNGGMYNSGYNSGMYNRFGMNGQAMNGEPSLSMQLEQSTQATFQMLDQIVQAFGGFAQMLESTFYATHSSFMAMAGVAEQFGSFRNYVGQVLSVMSVVNAFKRAISFVTGRRVSNDSMISMEAFDEFSKTNKKPVGSRKPIVMFLLMVVGLPWLMSKLIAALQQKKRLESQSADPRHLHPSQIRDLEFCRALYDYNGTNGDLAFKQGDIIAILSRVDPATSMPSDWWSGRLQSGRTGYFPSNYVQIITKTPSNKTMTSSQSTLFDSTEFN